MDLSVDENMILLQQTLEKERNSILLQQTQLLQQFREYVLQKIKSNSVPLEVRYCLINNDENLSYKNFNIGDEFVLELVSFKFNLQTELLIDYQRDEYQVTKKTEKIEDLPDEYAKKIFTVRKMKQPLSKTSEFDQKKINERKQKKVDSILTAIFKGKLVFRDLEFQRLVKLNFALENELQRIDKRISDLVSSKSR